MAANPSTQAPDPLDQPIAELVGHELNITTRCRCSKVVQFSPEQLTQRLGRGATLRLGEARMICDDCGQRPKLLVGLNYTASGGRDRRSNPPPLPAWVVPILREE